MLKSLIPIQHNRLPHCTFGSSSIELSVGVYSGDDINCCVNALFRFLAQNDSCWMRQWKESSFMSLQNGVLFSLLLQVVVIITETGNTAKCLIIFDQFTLLWEFPQSLRKKSFPNVETIKGPMPNCALVMWKFSSTSWIEQWCLNLYFPLNYPFLYLCFSQML